MQFAQNDSMFGGADPLLRPMPQSLESFSDLYLTIEAVDSQGQRSTIILATNRSEDASWEFGDKVDIALEKLGVGMARPVLTCTIHNFSGDIRLVNRSTPVLIGSLELVDEEDYKMLIEDLDSNQGIVYYLAGWTQNDEMLGLVAIFFKDEATYKRISHSVAYTQFWLGKPNAVFAV
jgi:hypothetical protein